MLILWCSTAPVRNLNWAFRRKKNELLKITVLCKVIKKYCFTFNEVRCGSVCVMARTWLDNEVESHFILIKFIKCIHCLKVCHYMMIYCFFRSTTTMASLGLSMWSIYSNNVDRKNNDHLYHTVGILGLCRYIYFGI